MKWSLKTKEHVHLKPESPFKSEMCMSQHIKTTTTKKKHSVINIFKVKYHRVGKCQASLTAASETINQSDVAKNRLKITG